ncbi:pentapeptide repeat-containing protein [Streptomyces sp. NPDC012510]|uniref:pentapeptide repeat-containing protein n=1 Tax=Streptomyces sp. NPDC012510 TaxID=3364838 RepID=UPI0036E8BB9D
MRSTSSLRPVGGSDFAGSDFAGSDFAGSDFAGSDFAALGSARSGELVPVPVRSAQFWSPRRRIGRGGRSRFRSGRPLIV